MKEPQLFILPLIAMAAAYLITGLFRGYALNRLVDVPNDRSSHVVPTPRGGGIAIVAVILVALPILGLIGSLPWRIACGLFGGGALVAIIGFADDHAHIRRAWRLLTHFLAAMWVVGWIGAPPLITAGGFFGSPWMEYALAVVYVVWLLNLFNFMDGIDGLAAVEVVTVCLAGVVVYVVVTPDEGRLGAPLVIAGAAFGFLLWNWPPAKIFMGDVGSGFLGLITAGLSLEAGRLAPRLFWCWIILLAVFVVDATVTLIRRAVRGDRFYEAHRTHAYQRLALRVGSHLPVTVAAALITTCWLLPLALLVALGRIEGVAGVLIAYIPLVLAALWLRAGEPIL